VTGGAAAGFADNAGMPLEVTAEVVRIVHADGRTEEMRWADLGEVRVVTTPDGPLGEDVFFVLAAADVQLAVPQAMATDAFISRLQALPGFDNSALIQAMYSVTDGQFLVWRA